MPYLIKRARTFDNRPREQTSTAERERMNKLFEKTGVHEQNLGDIGLQAQIRVANVKKKFRRSL